MASMKFDLPLLDYKTRFSLWQVKMRAILAQSQDLDEALDCFGKKKKDQWTPEEKRKDRKALSLIQLHRCHRVSDLKNLSSDTILSCMHQPIHPKA